MDPTYPPSDISDILDYTPQGCYTEGYNGRAVAFRQDQLSATNLTTEACLSACKKQNFPLAATEYGGDSSDHNLVDRPCKHDFSHHDLSYHDLYQYNFSHHNFSHHNFSHHNFLHRKFSDRND
ncbi:MAG: hypothetical protein Q9220_003240 [cf. Caloplaca sp. 1 TL-2023]